MTAVSRTKDGLALAIGLRKEGCLEESRSALLQLAAMEPDDAQINYQCAWAHDVLGLESEAIPFYECAIEKGLSGRDLEGALVGLGSSYRCVGKPHKAAETLRRGLTEFPACRAMQVFLALALYDIGKYPEAMKILLGNLAETSADDSISEYKKAILFYADKLEPL